MILVDTSILIDHLRNQDVALAGLLTARMVIIHPFVLGELALGRFAERAAVLNELRSLPAVEVASPSEVLELIEAHGLEGSGVGYVDAHLLAAARLRPGLRLWTRDKRLAAIARRLGVGQTLH